MQCRPPDGILEFLGLEGCAERVAGCGCVVRTYGNFVCSAVGIAIVIIAVLHIALDALDVLAAAFLVLLHFHFSFPLAVLCKRRCSFAAISFSAKSFFYTHRKEVLLWHFSS